MNSPVLTPAFAMLDAMPVPVMSFDSRGELVFANQVASAHPGKPHLVVAESNDIKLLIANMIAGKLSLIHGFKLQLAFGERLEGQFIVGPQAHLVSFVGIPKNRGVIDPPEAKRMPLIKIINFLGLSLGTPLSLVKGMLKNLEDMPAGDKFEHAIKMLGQRFKFTREMLALFGDGVVSMHDRIHLREAIDSILVDLDEKIVHSNVVFEIVNVAGGLPPIYGNKTLLMKALFEAMNNAITLSRREVKGKQVIIIRMIFAITGEHIMLSVFNRGAVQSSGKRIEVLESFEDVEDEKISKLGLGLVQRIIGLHGGHIRASDPDADIVEVVLEFPTGAPRTSVAVPQNIQALKYAEDVSALMQKRKKA